VYEYNGKYSEHRASVDDSNFDDGADSKSIEFNPWQYGNIEVGSNKKVE